MKINKKLIQNFLTIRYDPENQLANLAKWQDFTTKNSDLDGKKTEILLKKSVKYSIPDDEEPLAISLSSGIDSSLCLALLRDVFPNRKITAICGVFENGNDESKIAKKLQKNFLLILKQFTWIQSSLICLKLFLYLKNLVGILIIT